MSWAHDRFVGVQSQVTEVVRRARGLEHAFENTSLSRALKKLLGVPLNLDVVSVMQDRLMAVVRRRFAFVAVWRDRFQNLRDLKCPICGSHTVFRLCWVQTFRLYAIMVDHLLSVSTSEGFSLEDGGMCAAQCLAWSKFGSGATGDAVADLRMALKPFIDLSTLTGAGFLLRVAADISDLYFILTGKHFTIPTVDSFISKVRSEHASLMGVSGPEVVYNMWFAFSRMTSGPRSITLWLVHSSGVKDCFSKLVRFSVAWHARCGEAHVSKYFEQLLGAEVSVIGQIFNLSNPTYYIDFEKAVRPPGWKPKVVLPSWFNPKLREKPVYRDAVLKPLLRRGEASFPNSKFSGPVSDPSGLLIGSNAIHRSDRDPGLALQSLPGVSRPVEAEDEREGSWSHDSVSFEEVAIPFGPPRTARTDSVGYTYRDPPDKPPEGRVLREAPEAPVVATLSDEQSRLLKEVESENPDCVQQ